MTDMMVRLRCIGSAFVVAIAMLIAPITPEAAPVALVTDVVGDARHEHAPLEILFELDAGRELSLAADASVVVFYLSDGAEWTLKGPGRYRIAGRGPEPQGGAPAAQKRAGPPAFRDLKLRPDRVRQAAMILRSMPGHRLTLVSPAKQDVLLSSDVRFAWSIGATRDVEFEIEVVDATGRQVHKETTKSLAIALPKTARLVPGQRYTWAVLARERGLTQPQHATADFTLADAATRQRLDAARPGPGSPFSRRALFVALLESHGATSAAQTLRRSLGPQREAGWAASK